jgi:hypothetical protein
MVSYSLRRDDGCRLMETFSKDIVVVAGLDVVA